MRTASGALVTLFEDNRDTIMVDLVTLTLATGTVYRWTSHGSDITTGGNTFTSGGTGTAPLIGRGRIRDAVGLDPSDLDLQLWCGSSAQLGTVKLQLAAVNGVLDAARVKLERCYLDSAGAVVGTLNRFEGQVSEVIPSSTSVQLKVRSDLESLNEELPRNLYREKCNHALFSAGCGVVRASYTTTTTAGAGSTSTVVNHLLGSAPGYYVGGSITFTSGALTGQTRTIVANTTTTITVEFPFSAAPNAGNSFTASAGCDKSSSTCHSKFRNLPRRMGFDYIPTTESVGAEPTAEYARTTDPGKISPLKLYVSTGGSAQNSTYGKPIPLVYGTRRVGGTIILAGMYHQSISGYAAIGAGLIQIGLCEGPITEVISVWQEKTKSTPGALSLTTFPGAGITAYSAATTYSTGQWVSSAGTNYVSIQNANLNKTPASNPAWWEARGAAATERAQSAWSYLTTNYPTLAQGYGGLAYVSASAGWGTTADTALKRATFEVKGLLPSGSGASDAVPANILVDLLTNAEYGLGWSTSRLDGYTTSGAYPSAWETGKSGTAASSFYTYQFEAQAFISLSVEERRAAREIVQEVLDATDSEAVWSEGKLKLVPRQNILTGNSATWNPYWVPEYDLGMTGQGNDFLAGEGEDPISVEREALKDHFNCYPVEWSNRSPSRTDTAGTVMSEPSNAYNADLEEGTPDPADVALYGLRKAPVTQLRCITSRYHAGLIADAMTKRSIWARNKFRFRLGWRFALLEPLDLVTLTDSNLGLDRKLVRILEIEEDESGSFDVLAEEVGTQPEEPAAANGVIK